MLAALLPGEVFVILLIFVRVGAAMLLLPVFGEPFVSPRLRLLLALLVALLLTPILTPELPALPESPALLTALILGEALIGFFIGTVARVFMAALTTAGMVIAYMSSLANALTNDPSAAQQGSIAGSFLNIVALMIILALNLHHMLLLAVIDSYRVFVPGQPLPVDNFADTIALVVAKTFLLSMQIAAPFVAVGTIFYLGVGLLSRLMPQVQIFFMAMPMQITMGLLIFFLFLPAAMAWFLGSFEDTFFSIFSV